MAHDEVMLFRHVDRRWVQVVVSARRIDRTDGVKGRGLSHVYSTYKNPEAVRRAGADMRSAIHREGYRRVAKLGRFTPVPPEAWQDAATIAKPPRRPAITGKPRDALEARVAQLDAAPGVTLRFKRGKPASAAALAAAAKQLGRPLPASLRAFLLAHDGVSVLWKLDEEGWGVAFEIFSLREMLKEAKRRGAVLDTKAGRILPIWPTHDRPVLGVVLRDRGEAKVVEWMDPPDGKPAVLAPDVATFVAKAVASYFVIANRRDIARTWLPAMRRRFK